MGDIRTRRFHWLKPGTKYTFSVQAISAGSESDPTTITLKTSGFQGMTWPTSAKIKARPIYWSRTVVVKWTLMMEPLRMDFYRLFRKAGSPPTPTEKNNSDTSSPHWLKDTGRWAYHTDHLTGTSRGLDDWGNEIEGDVTYYYWVWAFDKGGLRSATALGPDEARFGDPEQPKIRGEGTTQVHERMKWLCDYTLQWECDGGCEYYLVQRKLDALPLWGPAVIVEHDSDKLEAGQYQEHTFDNLICGKKYDFRIKAVNIPIVFVSPWSAIKSYTTGEDQIPPIEIEYVAARRLYYGRKLLGEHIKLTWQRPVNAIIDQQIDYYRIYRLKGTDAEATLETAKINNSSLADDPVKPEPYAESTKFHGTFFQDDDLEELPTASGGGGFQGISTCNFEAPTTDLTVNGVAVSGTLNGTIATSTDYAQEGTYSLKSGASGSPFSNYLQWTDNTILNMDEGYVILYFRTTNLTSATAVPLLRTIEYSGGDYFAIIFIDDTLVSGNLQFYIERRVGAELRRYVYERSAIFSKGLCNDTWVKLEVKWKISNPNYQRLEVRVNDTTWYNSGTTTYTPQVTAPTGVRLGGDSSFAWYYDNLSIYDNYEGVATEINAGTYYHYWVTGVDIVGLESPVSGPGVQNKSYDKVSFSPPPPPTGLDVDWNTTLNLLSVKLMAAKIYWDQVDEATHFRVAVRTKPKGRPNWSKWFHSPYLREERIDDPDGAGKFYTWPFPLLQGTEFHYAVASWNAAGESAYVEKYTTVEADTTPPSEVQNLWGRSYGMFSLLLRKLWIGAKLTWDDLEPYEGVKLYQVQLYNTLTLDWDWVGNAHPTVGKKKVSFYDPGPPIANSHKYRVRAIDWDAVDENDVNHVSGWVEITIPWLQWWKIASS